MSAGGRSTQKFCLCSSKMLNLSLCFAKKKERNQKDILMSSFLRSFLQLVGQDRPEGCGACGEQDCDCDPRAERHGTHTCGGWSQPAGTLDVPGRIRQSHDSAVPRMHERYHRERSLAQFNSKLPKNNSTEFSEQKHKESVCLINNQYMCSIVTYILLGR